MLSALFSKNILNYPILLSVVFLSILIGSQTFGNNFSSTPSSIDNIIYNKQFKLKLSDKEKDWLQKNPVITLGIDRAFPPFGSITKDKKYVGFTADIMRIIEHRLGFKFDIKTDTPWNETIKMAKAGEINMISALVDSKQRQKFLNFSKSYIKNPTIIVNDTDNNGYIGSLKNLKGHTVAIERGSYSASVLSLEHPDIKLLPVKNTSMALSLVATGSADAYVGNGVTSSYLIRKLGYHNLSYSGQTEYSSSHSIGFIKGNENLEIIVKKALSSISKQELETIANYWFGMKTHSVVSKKSAIGIGLGLISLMIFLAIWAISLRKSKSALKVSHNIIEKQSEVDYLTGLGNRRQFYKRLNSLVGKFQTSQSDNPFTLLCLDLDLFKEVNDNLGHAIGDLLLIEVAKRLSTCDQYGMACEASRIGGDEFMIILPDLIEKSTLEKVVSSLQAKLSDTFDIAGNSINITTSIGITRYPIDTKIAQQLIINGDQAMYASKKKGRNCHSYFDKKMQAESQYKSNLTRDLRTALSKEQFTLHYQPIIHLKDNSITKAEALIRWNHPSRGLVSPAEFIPLAEESGLINDIGDWVFKTAIEHTSKIQKNLDSTFQMTINTSPMQYRKNGVNVLSWFDYLRSHNLNGENIIVEITEGVLMEAKDSVIKRLFQLRDLNVGVAIDDFGTGYSSLSYLKRFDIDYLKIDRSFVKNLAIGSDDVVLVQAIIVMAHQLGIEVVAEGIETKIQNDILIEAGCDYGQGFYFSKPLDETAFLELIDNWKEDRLISV